MRTAIFVYQPTLFNISTSETGLEICGLNGTTVPLSGSQPARMLPPGVYKIDSNDILEVHGNTPEYEVISAIKENVPKLQPTSRACSSFALLDPAALYAFLSTADARQLANP